MLRKHLVGKTTQILAALGFSLAAAMACQLTEVAITPAASEPGLPSPTAASDLTSRNPSAPMAPTETAGVQATEDSIGYSRANPIPFAISSVSLNNWDVRVVEMIRGHDAWQLIHAANAYNQPAADGWEYLLVRFEIANKQEDPEKRSIGLHVTGNRLVTHFSFDAGVVAPSPRLESTIPGGTVNVGWQAYQIRQNEGDLILIVDDVYAYDEPNRYVALTERAAISAASDAFRDVLPTDAGLDPSQPVLLGEIATTEDWQVTVLEITSGEEAWRMVLEANQFNDPPQKGMGYVIVRVRVGYIGFSEHGEFVRDGMFAVIDSSGEVYEPARVVDPEPELFFEIFTGGEVEGLLVFQLPEGQTERALKFQPDYYSDAQFNIRYLSLTQSGR